MQIKRRIIEGVAGRGITLQEDLKAAVECVAIMKVCANATTNGVRGFQKGDREGGREGEGGGETSDSCAYDYSVGRLGEWGILGAEKGG